MALKFKKNISIVQEHPNLSVDEASLSGISIAHELAPKWHMFVQYFLDDHSAVQWDRRTGFVSMRRTHPGSDERLDPASIVSRSLKSMPVVWTKHLQNYSCDVKQVHGVSASKSNLSRYTSLEEMLLIERAQSVRNYTKSDLDQALGELNDMFVSDRNDSFVQHAWNGQIYFYNSDGSHRMAKAKYLAQKLGGAATLNGPMRVHYINESVVSSLIEHFGLILVPKAPLYRAGLIQMLERKGGRFGISSMPLSLSINDQMLCEASILWFPRKIRQSRLIYDELINLGLFALGKHLSQLIENQRANSLVA